MPPISSCSIGLLSPRRIVITLPRFFSFNALWFGGVSFMLHKLSFPLKSLVSLVELHLNMQKSSCVFL